MKNEFTTVAIQGPHPSPSTRALLEEQAGIKKDVVLNYQVFEVRFAQKTLYCCWSGGHVEGGELHLTLAGQAALEALQNMPVGSNEHLTVKSLKVGPTPLKTKVLNTFKNLPDQSKVCFVGDLKRDLDGLMSTAFNLQSGHIVVPC